MAKRYFSINLIVEFDTIIPAGTPAHSDTPEPEKNLVKYADQITAHDIEFSLTMLRDFSDTGFKKTVGFSFISKIIVSGNEKLEIKEGTSIITLNAIYEMDVKKEYLDKVDSDESEWQFGSLSLSGSLIDSYYRAYPNYRIIDGIIGKKEVTYFNKRLQEDLTKTYDLIAVEVLKKKPKVT